MRDTIFISHATPEDNEFSIWLASRLELLGFKVWIDKNELLGGEKFWEDIDLVIRNQTIKFILVYSTNILQNGQPGKLRDGVSKEYSLAESIAKENPELKDFITLAKIDTSPYNLFIGSDRLNQISFTDNWGQGLELLVGKFQKDKIQTEHKQTEFSDWYLNNLSIKNPVVDKKELYYTNWWSVESIPTEFYIIKFNNEKQAKAIFNQNKSYPISIIANCISSFDKKLNLKIIQENNETYEISPSELHILKLSDLLLGFDSNQFPSHRDATNHFKKLFTRALHLFFKQKNLYWSELANKSHAYYHTLKSLPSSKVAFFYPFSAALKPKKKNLYGKYLTLGRWHFALSVKSTLNPFLGFSLKSHIMFTTDGFSSWEDKNIIHSHRRKKGKRMFNEEWRDLLLGFIASLKNDDGNIIIPIGENLVIRMKDNVELFWSDFGYIDPSDISRLEIFIEEDREDENEEEIEEAENLNG